MTTTPPPSTEDSLLPCPFCGESMPEPDERGGWRVINCGNCGASGPYPSVNMGWNRRALPEHGAQADAEDAARYRWLRDDATTHLYVRRYQDGIAEPINGQVLDVAIDAARATEAKR